MPDGRLLHLRDTYPIETAWAPQWVGDELRQVRAGAWDARLAAACAPPPRPQPPTRVRPRRGGRPGTRTWPPATRPCSEAYRQRETVFAGVMADRADWEAATRAQRHLAVAADAELRRRHPGAAVHPASLGRTRSPPPTPSARSSP